MSYKPLTEKNINSLTKTELYNRLYILEKGLKNGTLIELPCKVGDEIFEIIDSPRGMFISKEIIGEFVWNEYGLTIRTGLYTTDFIDLEQFGKTVFLTKAEAESKLKEQQNER